MALFKKVKVSGELGQLQFDDSLKMAERMQACGTPVKIKTYKDMWHVWQAFVGLFPEAGQSVKEIGEFLGEQLAPAKELS